MNIGKAIKRIRKEQSPKLNQEAFASSIGITQTYLSLLENGLKTPSIQTLEAICSQYNMPMFLIFVYAEESDKIKDKDIIRAIKGMCELYG